MRERRGENLIYIGKGKESSPDLVDYDKGILSESMKKKVESSN